MDNNKDYDQKVQSLIENSIGTLSINDLDENSLMHENPFRDPDSGQYMKAPPGYIYADDKEKANEEEKQKFIDKANKQKQEALDKISSNNSLNDNEKQQRKQETEKKYDDLISKVSNENFSSSTGQNVINKSDNINLSAKDVANLASKGKKLTDEIVNIVPQVKGKTVHPNYKNLSNQEMQQIINRINLENNYAIATGQNKYVKSGAEKTREIMQTVGSLIAIAGATAGLIQTIQQIKSKK